MTTERVEAAVAELYLTEPGDFVRRRAALAAAAKAAGDAAAGKAIGALKRPTMSAWLVNALVRADPDAVAAMTDLGDRMRGAQRALDAAELRELTRERRRVVADLVRSATGRGTPSATVTAEVTATIEAAIADAAVLDEVASGRLLKAVHWSGFGFGFGEPGLHAVPDLPAAPARPTAAKPRPDRDARAATAEERRRQERTRQDERRRAALEAAEAEAAEAAEAAATATDVEEQAAEAVRVLGERLGEARRMLDEARLDRRQAETRKRKATDALKRFRH